MKRRNEDPPIMRVSGAGMTARVYMESHTQRDVARRHLRRKYADGVQVAFEYFEHDSTRRAELERLRKGFMR